RDPGEISRPRPVIVAPSHRCAGEQGAPHGGARTAPSVAATAPRRGARRRPGLSGGRFGDDCNHNRGADGMRCTIRLAALAAFAALGLGGSPLGAQTYPTRTITVVVPFPAGGASDVVARIVTEHMSRTLGHQLVIENVGGAGGTLGSARVAAAPPDGYTLL